MSRVEETVRRQIGPRDTPGLVAVSGGADSCALLLSLTAVSPVPLTVVHVNHQLRGPESDNDQRFVEALAHRLKVPVRIATLPVSGDTRIEATARTLRYDWFRQIAAERHCGWLATGHTADDQAETVLHRLIRGTGIAGLGGIPAQRSWDTTFETHIEIVRPLLSLRRRELLDYLDQKAQPFRTDSTNADDRFTRNRIRHELLPLLAGYNPQIVESLTRLAEQSREAMAIVDEQADRLLAEVRHPDVGETTVLDADRLAAEPPYLVRTVFQRLWRQKGWPTGDMTAEHWQRLGQLTSADYPAGISVRCVGKVVQVRENCKTR